MVPVRKTVRIDEGVPVDLLVTPHMAVYEEEAGTRPISEDANPAEVMARYADLMYLAAINAWELDGHGTMEDFPRKRGDFHAFMQSDRKGFGEAMTFLVSALTGKSVKQLEEEERERRKKAEEGKPQEEGEPVKKKCFLCRLMSRSKRSS